MPKRIYNKYSFNAGEISPRLIARQDFTRYSDGLETATNCVALAQGSIRRRFGSKFIAETTESTARLQPFKFSELDGAIIEFVDSKFRIIESAGRVTDATKTITDITQADPAVMTVSTSGDIGDGDIVTISGVSGMTEVNGKTYLVNELTSTTYELQDLLGNDIDSTGFTAYSSGGSAAVALAVTSPYSSSELFELNFAQFGDELYVTHPDYEPRIIKRVSSSSWTMRKHAMRVPPTKANSYVLDEEITLSGTSGSVTATLDSGVFLEGDTGRTLSEFNSNGSGYGIITSVNGSGVATVRTLADFSSTTLEADKTILTGDSVADLNGITDASIGATYTVQSDDPGLTSTRECFRDPEDIGKYISVNGGLLRINSIPQPDEAGVTVVATLNAISVSSAWSILDLSFSSTNGYPQALTFYQNRLWYAGTAAEPQGVWGSAPGAFEDFAPGPDDDDALTLDLSGQETNRITWMATGRDIVIGTVGDESTLGVGAGTPITPSNVSQIPRTYYGSTVHTPAAMGNELLFLERGGEKIRALRYDINIDGYIAEDLTFIADHVTDSPHKQVVIASGSMDLIYAVANDGTMWVSTYDRTNSIIAWTRHTAGGSGLYKSVSKLTSSTGDLVYATVTRTINGASHTYVECIADNYDDATLVDGYMDSYLTYSDPKTVSNISTVSSDTEVACTSHGFSNGDKVKFTDMTDFEELEGKTWYVTVVDANNFEIRDEFGTDADISALGTFSGTANVHKLVTTISGLDHLEGSTVQILADGAKHNDKTVSSGSITLDLPSHSVVVGLPYTTTIKTLKPEIDMGLGTMYGRSLRHVSTNLVVRGSATPTLDGKFLPSRKSTDTTDKQVPFPNTILEYTGQNWGNSGQITITTSDPLPLEVVGLSTVIEGDVK